MIRFVGAILLTGLAGRLAAQTVVEAGVAVVGVASDPGFGGVGPSVRMGLGREIGVIATGAIGRRGDRWVGRGELAVQYRFAESRSRRPTWYLAGGVAGVTGRAGGSYLLAGLGLELPMGGRTGFWAEGGAAGGARIVAGFRSRLGAMTKRPP